MKAAKLQSRRLGLSAKTETLLLELGEECNRILKLLAQLEVSGLTEAQRETLLGDLSAAVLHLHEHTKDLDSIIESEP